MSNEEKILAELEAIRAELATVRAEVEELKTASILEKPALTPEQRLAAFHKLIDSISDEEAEEFGRFVDEMEPQKGGVI